MSKSSKGMSLDISSVFTSLPDMVNNVCDLRRQIEQERTKQTEIVSRARVEIERIRAQRDIIMSVLDKTFDERKFQFAMYFQLLDNALSQNQLACIPHLLNQINTLANSSPFKALQDSKEFQQRLLAKDTEWKF